jgi:hypothetical protein
MKAKPYPKKLNLYVDEDLQDIAKELAKRHGVSVSKYMCHLIDREANATLLNVDAIKRDALKTECLRSLARIGLKVTTEVSPSIQITSTNSVNIALDYRQSFPPVYERQKLIQSIAFLLLKYMMRGYVFVLPDMASDVLVANFKGFVADNTHAACKVTRVRDLDSLLAATLGDAAKWAPQQRAPTREGT